MGETTKEGMIVRKIILVFALFLSLVACSKPSQGLEKVTNVPDSIQEHVNYQHRLQSVRDKDGGSYLVFHSNGEATVDFTIDGKMVRIQFTETNVMDDGVAVVPHAYYLYLKGDDYLLEVTVNGEPLPFDSIVL